MKWLFLLLVLAGCGLAVADPNDLFWFEESNSVEIDWGNSTTTLAFSVLEIEPTFEITFDANSNPLAVGRAVVHWLKTNPEDCKHIIFYIPLKEKSEYLAILAKE